MDVLGHRGSRRPGPENSLRAVREALADGVDGVEIDVRRTRDGGLVCHHDPVFGVREGGRADRERRRPAVIDYAVAELAGELPTVDDMLDVGAGGHVVLEVKNQRRQPDWDGRRGTSARLLVDLLRRRQEAGRTDDVVVSSFNDTALIVARAAGHRTAVLTLPQVPVSAGLRLVGRGGHVELHAHISALPIRMPKRAAAAVAKAHEQGVRMIVWTVTDTDDALRLRDVGVDGVICDNPSAVARALRG